MPSTRLEYVKGASRKFWEVAVKGRCMVVHFGRLGTKGQSHEKQCGTPAAAQADAAKLTAKKLSAGYTRAGVPAKGKASEGVPAAPVPAAVARFRKELEKLIPAWFEASQRLAESEAEALGGPCSPGDLDALEAHLGRPLPASYRAYLTLYGRGKKKSVGEPFGPAEQLSKQVRQERKESTQLFLEFAERDPFAEGAILFIAGSGRKRVLLERAESAARRKKGEMDVVDYDITEEMQRFPDVVAYFRHNLAVTLKAVERQTKASLQRGVRTQRDAIDAVLASGPAGTMSPTAFRASVLRLRGQLPGGSIPSEALVSELRDADESRRFVAALRKMPKMLGEVIESLVAGAAYVYASGDAAKRATAFPLLELISEIEPKGKSPWWLKAVLTGMDDAYRKKDFALSATLADLARPFARESPDWKLGIPHNAARAFAAVRRYDDAVEMCRVAVETKTAKVAHLKTDKAFAPLLRRPDFKALFS